MSEDDEFLNSLLETFRDDADTLIHTLSDGLFTLEEEGTRTHADIIENIFRSTHSLKGASRVVKLKGIETVCQNMENIFSLMKKGEYIPDKDAYDLFHNGVAVLRDLVFNTNDCGIFSGDVVRSLRELLDRINDNLQNSSKTPSISPSLSKNPIPQVHNPSNPDIIEPENVNQSESHKPEHHHTKKPNRLKDSKNSEYYGYYNQKIDTVRISSEKLNKIITSSEDLLATRLSTDQRVKDLQKIINNIKIWEWSQTQNLHDIHNLRGILNETSNDEIPTDVKILLEQIIAFFRFNRQQISNLKHDISSHIREVQIENLTLDNCTHEISDLIHSAVLIPVSTILNPLIDHVRENARNLGKQADLVIIGADIEMDRRILEMVRIPIVHMIHNSLDHGIEDPTTRKKHGKSPKGLIAVKIVPQAGNTILFEISDDGGGIDFEKVRDIAVEKGFIPTTDKYSISNEDLTWFTFKSGLTTSPMITDLSGRGLGLAIVEENVTKLGGTVNISSEPKSGTIISMTLPLQLATMRGVVIKSADSLFTLPIRMISQVMRVNTDFIEEEDEKSFIKIETEKIPVISMAKALGIENNRSDSTDKKIITLVILSYPSGKIACAVDEIINVQEMVLRTLGSQIKKLKKFTGAVILADGRMALAIDPVELTCGVQLGYISGYNYKYNCKTSKKCRRNKILIADDSVTSRTLVKHFLENAGYEVISAPDGVSALKTLEMEEFDMLITDIDMPRMNGFSLVSKVRENERFGNIPIIILTSLYSKEDLEHGKNVGANAYMVKREFQEKSLLAVVHDLLP